MTRKALRPLLQLALIGLCLAPLLRQLAHDWSSVSQLLAELKAPALIGAGLLLVASSLFLPVAMAAFTRGASRRIGLRDSGVAYFGSQPMKYLPGSFWILPGRVVLLQRLGHDAGLATGGLAFEMTTQVLSASLVAAVLLGLDGIASVGVAGGVWAVLAGSLIAAALLLASPTVARRLHRGPARLAEAVAQLAEIPFAARLRSLAVTVLAFTAMWLVMGTSFYLLLVAAEPRLDFALLKTAVGISTLSWLVGFLAPFSPGGIGVRESAIVLLLGQLAPGPGATLVALLSRVLALTVELGFALLAWRALRTPSSRRLAKQKRAGAGEPAQRTERAAPREWAHDRGHDTIGPRTSRVRAAASVDSLASRTGRAG